MFNKPYHIDEDKTLKLSNFCNKKYVVDLNSSDVSIDIFKSNASEIKNQMIHFVEKLKMKIIALMILLLNSPQYINIDCFKNNILVQISL